MENGKKMTKTQTGFTLIELLVVVSIVGILSTATFLALNPADLLRKARDSKRKQDLHTIAKYFELYAQRYGDLPNGSVNVCQTDAGLDGSDDRSIYEDRPGYTNSWLKQLVTGDIAPKVPDDPDDPDGGGPPNYEHRNVKNGYYEYWKNQLYKSSWCWEYKRGHFVLETWLEYNKDPDCLTDENGNVYSVRGYNPPRCGYILQDGSLIKTLKSDSDPCPEIDECHPL
ncbi:hypothetical protein COS81_00485 [candidate division WWE3 bacterium CG06_land_8_20_14_3_00_42_16]|uniref:Type II secretion system protein GspG C-terminal domain-containing protein n=3 Tax=Katanobacteria TaxID=422282 RepID=A0A2M7APM8_UNCKA|nr:MAG: hypothetical protein COS81_00485 [candidate division WWE3 bacterium CG06_land_8_20_14_3_00_42_16]PJC69277.1 MAG: hypothetical protein CO015_00950 [candidate division WWE3 bacterium CG_4_8_14_3_um_filter_42_11]